MLTGAEGSAKVLFVQVWHGVLKVWGAPKRMLRRAMGTSQVGDSEDLHELVFKEFEDEELDPSSFDLDDE